MNKIHIGYPKTATTYLQKHIFIQLKNHSFIGHPEFHRYGLIDIIWKADRSIDYGGLRKRFEKKAHFISFENLVGPLFHGSMMIDEMPKRLMKIFGNDTKILIIIRRQDDLIKSSYIQYIHKGGTMNLRNFLFNPRFGNNRIDLNSFDFYETFLRYKNEFGKQNVKVLPYEELKNQTQCFEKHLQEFFVNEKLNFSNNEAENRSLSGLQLKCLRFINRFLFSEVSEKYIVPPWLINQDNLRFGWQKMNFLRYGRSFSLEEEELIKGVLPRFYQSNSYLDDELKLGLKDYGYYI